MIGLVDSSTQVVNPESNDLSFHITGRDLSKLFIEDGVFLQALESSQGLLKLAGQSTQKSSLINRLFSSGGMSYIGLYMFTSIEHVLKFIMQQLAVIQIVPDDLFTSYGDRRNKRFNEIGGLNVAANSNHKPQYKEELASGIWQLVKLVIDKSVAQRTVADSSMSSANGSLLNFLNCLCQEPLVEFYMDTYGDQYHLIARKPPHDQKALISLIEGKVNTETGTLETPPAIVDIDPVDVLEEQLIFDDNEAYSWYHFYPRAAMIGDTQNFSLSYLPALFFEEYAKIWGNKPYHKSNTYLPFLEQSSGRDLDLSERQAIEDLKFVVESHQYLPFTRKGRITVNRNRKLKIGNVLRYKSTGEIFFIDSVTHNHSISDTGIDATTVIGVSRGMVEQLVYGAYYAGENGTPRFVSYFNIINTSLSFNEKITTKQVVKNRPNITKLTPEEKILQPGNIGTARLEKYNQFPANKNLFIRFINGINTLGYRVVVTDSNRSFLEQWELKYGRKGNLSNAEPGHSKHEHGMAIDINLINDKTGNRLHKSSSQSEWINTGVPSFASTLGLRWAGGDGSFGNYVDRVHFEMIGSPIIEAVDPKPEYETITTRMLDREGIFSNFKVNPFSFNFFLKKLQFDPAFSRVKRRVIYESGGQLLPEVFVRPK